MLCVGVGSMLVQARLHFVVATAGRLVGSRWCPFDLSAVNCY